VTTLASIFLTSEHAARLADFYIRVVRLPFERVGGAPGYVYWKCDQAGVQIAIHDAEAFATYSYPSLAGSNLTHLYFRIDNQPELLDHLEREGIPPLSTDSQSITIRDPDGRTVLFGTY